MFLDASLFHGVTWISASVPGEEREERGAKPLVSVCELNWLFRSDWCVYQKCAGSLCLPAFCLFAPISLTQSPNVMQNAKSRHCKLLPCMKNHMHGFHCSGTLTNVLTCYSRPALCLLSVWNCIDLYCRLNTVLRIVLKHNLWVHIIHVKGQVNVNARW